ncbi:MAG: transporter [Sulfurimonas sp.]|nr:transporter [Sulfurimonas sp.]
MYRLVLALLCMTTSSYAYVDSDFDGVEDAYDLCPQTPLSDLVDADGCMIKSTETEISYDLVFGMGYSQINYASQEPSDTLSSSLQADIYTGRWWFQLVASHYKSDDGVESKSGLEDTSVSIMYRFTPTEKLSITTGVGLILPTYKSTYNNEETDYMASVDLDYDLNSRFSLFFGSNYTLVNDSDVTEEKYQNSYGFYAGAKYIQPSKKSALSAAYYQNESIYTSTQTIKYLSLGYTYMIDNSWNIGGHYGHGLSDSASDKSISAYVGYTF